MQVLSPRIPIRRDEGESFYPFPNLLQISVKGVVAIWGLRPPVSKLIQIDTTYHCRHFQEDAAQGEHVSCAATKFTIVDLGRTIFSGPCNDAVGLRHLICSETLADSEVGPSIKLNCALTCGVVEKSYR